MGQENRHSWREACASALTESDPLKLLGCIEYALSALQRRYAEWDSDPCTSAELNSIRKTILALERHLKEKIGRGGGVAKPAPEFLGTTHQGVARELGQVSRLFLVRK